MTIQVYLCAAHTRRVEVHNGTPLHIHDATHCSSPSLVGPGGPRPTEQVLAAEMAKALEVSA